MYPNRLESINLADFKDVIFPNTFAPLKACKAEINLTEIRCLKDKKINSKYILL